MKKIFILLVIQSIYLFLNLGQAQTISDSYEKLWQTIDSEKESEETKLKYIDVCIKKAIKEKIYYKNIGL